MFSVLSYPLNTIYINRIAGTPTFSSVGENLPKEFLTICERGGPKTGYLRGFVPFIIYGNAHRNMDTNSERGWNMANLVVGTVIMNWLSVIHTKRVLIESSGQFETPAAYGKMFAPNMLFKTFTLGMVAHLLRNSCMGLALLPRHQGAMDEVIGGIFALGATAVSHPFEVARVLIVKNDGGRIIPTLRAIYEAEGVAGCFKGFIPRSLAMVPLLMGMQYSLNPRHSNICRQIEGFSDKQEGYDGLREEKRIEARIF